MTQRLSPTTRFDALFERTLPPDTLRIAQVTDTHLYADPEQGLLGLNTLQSLKQVLAMIQQLHCPLDAVLATGDLVHDASAAGYHRVGDELATLGAPVYCLAGNHDESQRLKDQITNDRVSTPASVDIGRWRIVLLDSVIPHEEGGHLDDDELELLTTALSDHDRHALVCLHHQPVPVGSRWIDTMRLDNADEFFAIIDRSPQVRGVLWGHVHQTFEVERNGVALMATPSTCVQFAPQSEKFRLDPEPPGCRLLALLPDGRIETQVVRVKEVPHGLDFATAGY